MALAKVKDDLSRYLRLAEAQEILITRHGRPAGVLIGFQSEDDWFEYQLEQNPDFLRRIANARREIRDGLGIKLEAVPPSKGGLTTLYLDSSVKGKVGSGHKRSPHE